MSFLNKNAVLLIIPFFFCMNINANVAKKHNLLGFATGYHYNTYNRSISIDFGLNRYYSSCLNAKYLNGIFINYKYYAQYSEYGFKIRSSLLKKHLPLPSQLSPILSVNPGILSMEGNKYKKLKPEIGIFLHTNPRRNFFALNISIFYGYDIFIDKININSNHTITIIFGFDSKLSGFKNPF